MKIKMDNKELQSLKVGKIIIVEKRVCKVMECKICKRRFLRDTKIRKSGFRGNGSNVIRGINTVTCSRKCSREKIKHKKWKHLNTINI